MALVPVTKDLIPRFAHSNLVWTNGGHYPKINIPTGKVPLAMLTHLCKRGSHHQPVESDDGWLTYRWESKRGTIQLSIRTTSNPDYTEDDAMAARALARASSADRAGVELTVILARLAELDGIENGWNARRVLELMYGSGRNAHHERHTADIKGWLALFERGCWDIDAPYNSKQKPKKKGKSKNKGESLASYGGKVEGHLLTIERTNQRSATVHLHPEFAKALKYPYIPVPTDTFLLPPTSSTPLEDHCNPEGNKPSRAAKARIRIAGAILGRLRQNRNQRVSAEELLSFAALDLAPVKRRRRLGTWVDVIIRDLIRVRKIDGVGLDERPTQGRHVLRMLLRLVVPVEERGPPKQLAA